MLTKIIGWLLGLGEVRSIGEIRLSLAASWAVDNIFWIFLAVVALWLASIVFYLVFQQRGSTLVRAVLGVWRGLLIALLLLTLCDPILQITDTVARRPALYLVFDGTDSMAIEDELTDAQRAKLIEATGLRRGAGEKASRLDYLQALLRRGDDNLLAQLQDKQDLQIEAFIFDGNSTSQLRKLDLNADGGDRLEVAHLSSQLTAAGQVTAIGAVLGEVGQQVGGGKLAGVVLFSDFAHNSGVAPLGNRSGSQASPAQSLGAPIYTVGVGATETVDLAVDIQTDPKMKRAERTTVMVKLRQTGLDSNSVAVRVFALPLSGQTTQSRIAVGEKTVTLSAAVNTVEFPFTPQDAGRFEFVAEVDPIAGEVVDQNNRAARQVNIIDDYLRLMYVAYEPTWEWRFVKEVFHRDKLIGMEGFRTYLASSDAKVRESNVLFLPILTPQRSQFFANDVIFLGDMPGADLNDRFCEMVKEFVGKFGGGLVVISGPRFGPQDLHDTPLADMLPVIVDPRARMVGARADDREFSLRLTPYASRYPFMQLGQGDVENAKAWSNMSQLPWFQPVSQVHQQAVVLAEHPSQTCDDGKTPQPLIAVRQYGAGEVVYLGFNEMWRLRRMYGERYYREFWSQLIYRLGMSHALGQEKRFVVRTDRQQYRADETVTLTIEAYDENFEPLNEEKLRQSSLAAEIVLPGEGETPTTRPLSAAMLREGIFEARVPVYAAGEYTMRVKDPVTDTFREVRFDVADVSAERRSGVRNRRLQQELAAETRGRSYELTEVANLIDDIDVQAIDEEVHTVTPLWATPLWFLIVVPLMLGEWLIRKMVNLT